MDHSPKLSHPRSRRLPAFGTQLFNQLFFACPLKLNKQICDRLNQIISTGNSFIVHASADSFTLLGIDALPVTVEVDCVSANSLDTASWTIVGLGDAAVRESRERVKAALKNSGYEMSKRRVTVNLAPADVRKEGSHFDLPIALAVLASSGMLNAAQLKDYAFVGELGLDGQIRPANGVLPMAIRALGDNRRGLLVPEHNAAEAASVQGLSVYSIGRLVEAVAFLRGEMQIVPTKPMALDEVGGEAESLLDFSDVKGQEGAKRALEIAAAGGHNALMIGTPGSGKTMLAKRMPSILPSMTLGEALETTKIYSIAGKLNGKSGLLRQRPFRSPHHTTSNVALVGGGVFPRPGEVSLAHHGILFLDEFPEFSRQVLEVLRQPLEDGVVHVSRAQMSVTFPAQTILIAAMNPCPCGYATHPKQRCLCSPIQIEKYLGRISGPLLDRIDLHVDVATVPVEDLMSKRTGEPSAAIRERVEKARAVQSARFNGREGIYCNAQMSPKDMRQYCPLGAEAKVLLKQAMEHLKLSARAFDRILRVSRTIADLEGTENIETHHVSEAVNYRTLDRTQWV